MFWEANVSAGPLQGMLQVLSENDLRSAMKEAVQNFLKDDGSVKIQNNIFKYVSVVL